MKKFKNIFVVTLILTLLVGVSSCNSISKEEIKEKVTIKSYNAEKVLIDLEVPYKPQRIAILDMATLDIIDAIGEGDKVVGSASISIDYLLDYVPSKTNGIANLGTIKTADFEEVAACEPDIIFIGGRLSNVYNDLSKIASVVYLTTDVETGVVKSTENMVTQIGKIFGKEDEVSGILDKYKERINYLNTKYNCKNALVGMYSGNSYNVLDNTGRCSIIGKEIGFTNVGATAGKVTGTHGDSASWETIVNLNPEYMFVMDRNNAIGTVGVTPAKEAIENDLIMTLDCYKNGKIIYLAHPNVWYTAEGGIQALDIMLDDLETGLNLRS